jgi:hypothetical protein
VGLKYDYKDWARVGLRFRTGDPIKQQDPQITLGTGSREFGLLPFSFEKAYFQAKRGGLKTWFGKNSFPFRKSNELFWSDNVYPEGVFASYTFDIENKSLSALDLRAGHFIVSSAGAALEKDAYFQGLQVNVDLFEQRLKFSPSMFVFKNMADRPDGGGTYTLDYSLAHLGMAIILLEKSSLVLQGDYFSNLEDYNTQDSIPSEFKNQGNGFVLGLAFGTLKKKGDWTFKATYTELQRYAAVDYMAQNDWARWDYSSSGSPDGRLTNIKGIELFAGYAIDANIALKVKYYKVEQLISTGSSKETGDRIRFDIDIKF